MSPNAQRLLEECERAITLLDKIGMLKGTIDDIRLLGAEFLSRRPHTPPNDWLHNHLIETTTETTAT